jgi:formate hydrogenlyase subunit 3/multisubunit Na+/H+ antiporter MnhD subunit
VAGNLAILVVLAALVGAFALVLLNVLWRTQSRAHWRREAGIRRSRRLERRVFLVGVGVVLAIVAGGIALQMNRQPRCSSKIVVIEGPNGTPLECVCERGRRGACWEAGP